MNCRASLSLHGSRLGSSNAVAPATRCGHHDQSMIRQSDKPSQRGAPLSGEENQEQPCTH